MDGTYKLPETRLDRLERDLYWVLDKDGSYTQDKADKFYNDTIKQSRDEEKRKENEKDIEVKKVSELQNKEYVATFMETLLPVMVEKQYGWEDEIVCPLDTEFKFKLKNAIGAGNWNKNVDIMKREIVEKWLNGSLHFSFRIGYAVWAFDITFRLR